MTQPQEDPVLHAELVTFATVGAFVGAAAALGAPRPRLLAGFGFILLYSLAFSSPSGSGPKDLKVDAAHTKATPAAVM